MATQGKLKQTVAIAQQSSSTRSAMAIESQGVSLSSSALGSPPALPLPFLLSRILACPLARQLGWVVQLGSGLAKVYKGQVRPTPGPDRGTDAEAEHITCIVSFLLHHYHCTLAIIHLCYISFTSVRVRPDSGTDAEAEHVGPAPLRGDARGAL
eukprot:scaffold256488_cov22-Tisochrysis_lutea.AAC.1